MHEWALAEAVASAVIKEAEKRKRKEKRITKVKVMLGELQQIDVDSFKFALDPLFKSSPITAKAEVELEIEKCMLKCNLCGEEWESGDVTCEEAEFIHFIPEVAHAYMKCPKCKSPDFKIVRGRGVWVEYIKGDS